MIDLKETFRVTRTNVLVLVCLLSCAINAQPILYVENPEYHGQSNAFTCLSVRLTNNKTIITHRFKASNVSDRFWIYKGCYLQTFDSSRKYNLLYAKNASFDKYDAKTIHDYTDFTQVFEPLPANCSRFKYYEPDGRYETYDLNSFNGRKFVYSDNLNTNNFKRVADAFSSLISSNPYVIGISTEKNSFLSKIQKIEISFNNPTLTLLARFADTNTEWGFEFRFNVNKVQIEEYSFDSGKIFYVINNCLGSFYSDIVYHHLGTYNYCEDLISSQAEYCKSIIFNCDDPILNKRIGYALLALIKSARNPNEYIPVDFNKVPSGISLIKKQHGKTNNATNSRNGNSKSRTANRVPTLKKTK